MVSLTYRLSQVKALTSKPEGRFTNCHWCRRLMPSDRGAKIPLTLKRPYALNHLSTSRTFSPSKKADEEIKGSKTLLFTIWQ